MLKLLILFTSIAIYSDTLYASEKVINSIDESALIARELKGLPKHSKDNKQYSLKKVISNEEKTKNLIVNLFSIVDIDSPKDIESTLKKGTQNLFFASFFEKTPLISNFTFKLTRNPDALAKFTLIFFQHNKLLSFAFIMIGTLMFSHMLGEHKFKYPLFSGKRIAFGLFRFSFINSIRLGSFSLIFKDNFFDFFQLYASSVNELQHLYPILHFITDNLIKIF